MVSMIRNQKVKANEEEVEAKRQQGALLRKGC